MSTSPDQSSHPGDLEPDRRNIAYVYLSYEPTLTPDRRLAEEVDEALADRGHLVFNPSERDQRLAAHEILVADHVVAFLSKDSTALGKVPREAALAFPRVLPIRLEPPGGAGFPLAKGVGNVQWVWSGDSDTSKTIDELLNIMEGRNNFGPPYFGPDPPIQESVTVQTAISTVEPEGLIFAWRLVEVVLAKHPEYGRQLGAALADGPGPARGMTRRGREWIGLVKRLFSPQRVAVLDGRLLILGLAHLEPHLAKYLELHSAFLSVLGTETEFPFDTLLIANSSPAATHPIPPQPIQDPTPLHLDTPATVDHLGRRGFARALAIRLEKIWREMNPVGVKKAAATHAPRGSFILHLHGEWGSGKSSILEFLRTALTAKREADSPRTPAVAAPWIVVDFNAWQNQRLDPPWWPLLDAIYRQAARQLSWGQRLAFRWREGWWRTRTKRADILIFLLVLVLVGIPLYLIFRSDFVSLIASGLEKSAEKSGNISDILALVTAFLTATLVLSRSLLTGSARAAQSFLETAADPMERIQRHFQKMVGTIERPIAVFVDDLDRCQSGYVVQLLEGIQTLFRDPRVVYVIAADQRWLHACFERTYEDFAESVHEPGRRLGSLFLEKAFEISIAVPNLSPAVQAEYWRHLLGGDSEAIEREAATFEREARAEFAGAASEQQVVSRLAGEKREATDDAPAETPNPLRDRIRREAAVERLANATIEKSVSYFLHPFAPLLDPNPRSMKRLLNAYAIRRDLAILAGHEVLVDEARRKKLALWVILSLRWPAIEDDLRARAAGQADEPSEEVAALLQTAEVRRIVEYLGAESPLTLADIAGFEGFEALNEPQSPAAAE